jgi:putative membrane protein
LTVLDSTGILSPMAKPRVPHFLFLGYVVLWLWAAIEPYDRATWWAENIPIMILVGSLVAAYVRGVHLSNLAWILMAVLPYWHTIGGHYTFERVPFDWFNNLFGFKRNMFDRIGHFSVGFYAYGLIEYLESRNKMSRTLACMFAIFTIAFVAMSYELIEWGYAATAGGESGANFLGSQGDIWDAQKDMLMDTLGAVIATALYLVLPARRAGPDGQFPPAPRGRATVAGRQAA